MKKILQCGLCALVAFGMMEAVALDNQSPAKDARIDAAAAARQEVRSMPAEEKASRAA